MSDGHPPPARRQWANPSLLHSYVYAFQGLSYAFRRDRNVRIDALATLLVLGWGWKLGLSIGAMLWLALACTMVVVAELFNTALEAVVDLASPEHHPLAKVAKDVSAAAVMIVSFFAVGVGLTIFGAHFG